MPTDLIPNPDERIMNRLRPYLRGAHIGDEGSRDPAGPEQALAIVGLILVAAGFALMGVARLDRRSTGAEPDRVLATDAP